MIFENLDGILSLFFACIEIVLVINLLIFAEKNSLNITALALLFVLLLYQLTEFLICYGEFKGNYFIYLGLLIISIMPPLGLKLVLNFHGYTHKLLHLIFVPALFFIFYFPTQMDGIELLTCSPFAAGYKYPLGFLYGVFYYLPILMTMILLGIKHKTLVGNKTKKLSLALIIGFYFSFVPGFVLGAIATFYNLAVESILCKIALILAFALAYFIITNRTEKST